jgi:hypothetical protein
MRVCLLPLRGGLSFSLLSNTLKARPISDNFLCFLGCPSTGSNRDHFLQADFRVVIGPDKCLSDLASTENAVRGCLVVWNGLWAKKPVVRQLRKLAPTYSSRSRIRGLTDSARCAGIQVASNPSAAIARTTPARTRGSRGVA